MTELDDFIRDEARKDPAFATGYLNARARRTVIALVGLIDGTALDWSKVDGDNKWLVEARKIVKDGEL